MSHTTIWIDHQHAYIFEYTAKGVAEKDLKNSERDDKEHLAKFFHELTKTIGSPNQLLIVGPGIAKEEFKNYCEAHNNGALAKVIVGTETMKDHPRKSEILAASRKFFDHHFAWHNYEA